MNPAAGSKSSEKRLPRAGQYVVMSTLAVPDPRRKGTPEKCPRPKSSGVWVLREEQQVAVGGQEPAHRDLRQKTGAQVPLCQGYFDRMTLDHFEKYISTTHGREAHLCSVA